MFILFSMQSERLISHLKKKKMKTFLKMQLIYFLDSFCSFITQKMSSWQIIERFFFSSSSHRDSTIFFAVVFCSWDEGKEYSNKSSNIDKFSYTFFNKKKIEIPSQAFFFISATFIYFLHHFLLLVR